MFKKIFLFLFILTATTLFASAQGKGKYYVNTKTLKVRLAPTTKSLHSYSIYKNYKVRVYEVKNSWARISKYKTTTVNGKFTKAAKWVFGTYLTKIKSKHKRTRKTSKRSKVRKKASFKKSSTPITPKKNTDLIRSISSSDNYAKFSTVFIATSKKLVEEGKCKASDFRKTRGWIDLSRDDLYFTYCGGFSKKNKIYLNVKTSVLQTF